MPQPNAVATKTAPAPAVSRISPARSGATSSEALVTVPEATLEAVSSAGSLASDGRIEPWTGRVRVTAVAVAAAIA